MTEQQLLQRFRRSGHPDDLAPLYQGYAPLIYGWCLNYLGTPERAQDAGGEIFSVLLEKLPKHEVHNFRSWLQTTVRNHCLMQLRREKRDPLRQKTGDEDMQFADWPHLADEAEADTRPLYRCLKELKEEQAHCIRLFYLSEGESYRSIAKRLNLSVGQVRSHLQNGRRNLKICLERNDH